MDATCIADREKGCCLPGNFVGLYSGGSANTGVASRHLSAVELVIKWPSPFFAISESATDAAAIS